jgi:hypothetical protein
MKPFRFEYSTKKDLFTQVPPTQMGYAARMGSSPVLHTVFTGISADGKNGRR